MDPPFLYLGRSGTEQRSAAWLREECAADRTKLSEVEALGLSLKCLNRLKLEGDFVHWILFDSVTVMVLCLSLAAWWWEMRS